MLFLVPRPTTFLALLTIIVSSTAAPIRPLQHADDAARNPSTARHTGGISKHGPLNRSKDNTSPAQNSRVLNRRYMYAPVTPDPQRLYDVL